MFDETSFRDMAYQSLRAFLGECRIPVGASLAMSEKMIKEQATTMEDRQKILEKFFRAVFSNVSKAYSFFKESACVVEA